MILLPSYQGRILRAVVPEAGRGLAFHRQLRSRARTISSRASGGGDAKIDNAVLTNYLEKEKKTQNDVAAMRQQATNSFTAFRDEVRKANRTAQSPAGGVAESTQDLEKLRAKLLNAIRVMQHGLVERDIEVRLLLLAAMCGEHILLIGPPGTAKSEVSRRLNKLIKGTYFERLLTRFSVPEELFGPLSMTALEKDRYERQTIGYLPKAEVAFIDEIFKANSAILNTLLTLINERKFDNGARREDVPLISIVGASNELPESEELDALYDRFLVRRCVRQVSAAGVRDMLDYFSGNSAPEPTFSGSSNDGAPSTSAALDAAADALKLTREDIVRCKQEAVRTVKVPKQIIDIVTDLRTYLQEKLEPVVYVSDRRLVKSIQLLQVASYCNGRTVVSESDLLLLQYVLWQRPEQAERIHDWVMGQLSVDDGAKQVKYLLSSLFSRACRSLGSVEKTPELLAEITGLRRVLGDKLMQIESSMIGDRLEDNLWLGREEAEAVATALKPKLEKTRAEVETVLMDVSVLEVAVNNNSSPVALASLLPRHWADFIRNSDIKDVKPIGTTPSPFKAKP